MTTPRDKNISQESKGASLDDFATEPVKQLWKLRNQKNRAVWESKTLEQVIAEDEQDERDAKAVRDFVKANQGLFSDGSSPETYADQISLEELRDMYWCKDCNRWHYLGVHSK